MTKTIRIEGMSCQHCVKAVTKALTGVAGVQDVRVDLEGKAASVDVSDAVADDALRAAVEDAGYDVVGIS